jgi:hypothetical protein
MTALAGIVIVAAAMALVLSPLVRGTAAPLTDGPDRIAALRELHALRDVTYETLRDLEFDYHSGKISEADYKELGDRYRAEAVGLVRRIDALAAMDDGPGVPDRR